MYNILIVQHQLKPDKTSKKRFERLSLGTDSSDADKTDMITVSKIRSQRANIRLNSAILFFT